MQPAKNYDVDGNLKLRGKILDRTVTEGGFYSGQFGEVGYKSDLPPGGGTPFSLTVRMSNPPPSYSDVVVVSFNEGDFYLAQSSGNTDEVSVHLKNPNYLKIIDNPAPFYTPEVNTAFNIAKFTIPANTLDPGGRNFIRGEYIGFHINKTTIQNMLHTIKLGGSTIYTDTDTTPAASAIERATTALFHILPRDINSVAFVIDRTMQNVTVPDVGYGAFATAPTSYSIAGNWYCNFNYTQDQEFLYELDNLDSSISLVTRDFRYFKWELCEKE